MFGIVSYNFHMNFINYGSALQSFALQRALDRIGVDNVIVDYIPKCLEGVDMDKPLKHMKDSRFLSRMGCVLSLPDIKRANEKYRGFIRAHCRKTERVYHDSNFNDLELEGYICGSDTIWCIQEFDGEFDDGYFANYSCMKGKRNIAYSASFGDAAFSEEETAVLKSRMANFTAAALREPFYMELIRDCVKTPPICSIDPTLLLDADDYEQLLKGAALPREREKYILLYSRSYDERMVKFADQMAAAKGLKVIEISLRATNLYKHDMRYDTGVEEFIFLIKNAESIITNSYHGAIFSIQFRKDFYLFTRKYGSKKMEFLLEQLGLSRRLRGKEVNAAIAVKGDEDADIPIDYEMVWQRILPWRKRSYDYLIESLKEESQNGRKIL